MRVIIAPAKKMNTDLDSFPPEALPQFLDRTERLMSALQAMSPQELQALWKCNEAIGELKGGKVAEKGTVCKMARGQMVRWLAENNVTDPENIKNFADLDYCFSSTCSTENNYVFIRKKEGGCGR